jgi:hypothetical protein
MRRAFHSATLRKKFPLSPEHNGIMLPLTNGLINRNEWIIQKNTKSLSDQMSGAFLWGTLEDIY